MLLYGLDVDALSTVNPLFGDRRRTWHPMECSFEQAPLPSLLNAGLDDHFATLSIPELAEVIVSREDRRMRVLAPAPMPESNLVHPVMAFVASAMARWTGRSALHGGVVVLDGQAWVVLASAGGGKSTVMSEFSYRGYDVMADDLAVIDNGVVVGGPRSCDLREPSSTVLGRGEAVPNPVGRERWRVKLPPAPAEAPLVGLVDLRWGDRVASMTVPVHDRLARIADNDALRLGPENPEAWLPLIATPMFTVERPREWSSLGDTVEIILELASRR